MKSLFFSMHPKRKNKPYFGIRLTIGFFIMVSVFSCQDSQIDAEKSSETPELSADSLLCSFISSKYEYLQVFNDDELLKEVEIEMGNRWKDIIKNKEIVINYLLEFENDSSGYSLYYNDSYLYGMLIGRPMPDNLHALYLIEGILQGDYLFNRRFCPNCYIDIVFKNDGINYIYWDSLGSGYVDTISIFHFKIKQNPDVLKEAWDYYRQGIEKGMESSPLQGTGLKWNCMRDMFLQKDSIYILDSLSYEWHNTFLRGEKMDSARSKLGCNFKSVFNSFSKRIN